MTIRLGTRASLLATTQSGQIAEAIKTTLGHPVDLVEIRTEGDVNPAPLTNLGGTGVFVSALRTALLAGEVDVIVHSMKDLPTAAYPGVELAAVPLREDARDAVVGRDTLGRLPSGSRIGTGSPRRVAQLLALGLPVEVVGVRGNVDTRIGKVTSGDLDAVVLAAAGLSRIGRLEEIVEYLDVDEMMPAPGQGALAVECRQGDRLAAELSALDHAPTRACVAAERTVLGVLQQGCSAPIGAWATQEAAGAQGEELTLTAVVASLDGTSIVRARESGTDPDELGRAVAATLIARGAHDLVHSDPIELSPRRPT